MWFHKYSVEAEDITKEQVWELYRDVSGWPDWDFDVKWAILIGEFKSGGMVEIKPTKGPKVKAIITDCVENKIFTNITELPLKTTVQFSHLIEEYDNKIEGPYLKFCNFVYDKLDEPYNGKSPIWCIIIDGKFEKGEGYNEIPDFQGREEEIVQKIEQAISK